VPFQTLVIFSTNIRPGELVDEAFLRRIQHKVYAESPTAAAYAAIFERCCQERGIPYEPALVQELMEQFYRPRRVPLRACHPRDLIDHALAIARYRGDPLRLTDALLAAACVSYFIDDREMSRS
jgi:SpoVK/Ycf46/Vps4 family AAA+-type ATPase